MFDLHCNPYFDFNKMEAKLSGSALMLTNVLLCFTVLNFLDNVHFVKVTHAQKYIFCFPYTNTL